MAELEVYELGRNLAQGMVAERNGSAESSHEGSVGNLVDGEGTALTFSLKAFQSSTVTFGERFLEFDLGAVLLARRCANMKYNLGAYSLANAKFYDYTIRTSDGTACPRWPGCCGRRPNSSAAKLLVRSIGSRPCRRATCALPIPLPASNRGRGQ